MRWHRAMVGLVLAMSGCSPATACHDDASRSSTDVGGTRLRFFVLPRTASEAVRLDAVTIRPLGLRDVPFSRRGDRVVYPEALPETDVEWFVEGDAVEEIRVLKGPSAPLEARYHIDAPSVRVRNQRVEVLDAHGALRLRTEPLYALDAAGTRRELELSVAPLLRGFELTVRLDASGLRYPIVVDPAWVEGPPLTVARRMFAAVGLPDGRVVAAGGNDGANQATRAFEIFQPSLGVFTLTVANYQGAGAVGAATASGKVLIVGGFDRFNAPSSYTNLIVPTTGVLTALAGGNLRPRYRAALVSSGEKVYALGGSKYADTGNWCTVIDLAASTPTWANLSPMVSGREGHAAALLDSGAILVVGGGASGAELYQPGTNTWSSAGTNTGTRVGVTATKLSGGKVLVVGGGTATTEVYTPGSGFAAGPSMTVSRTDHTATLLNDGRVLVVGGGTATAEVYSPTTNTWGSAGAMSVARSEHGATKMVDGRVLVLGGRASSAPTGTAEIWGSTVGMACTTTVDCVAGTCVDGVCCSTTACASGLSCAVPGKKGTCSRPLGATCVAGSECGSGFCVDGVCCDSACGQQCAACNAAGRVGTCSPHKGAPLGGRAACGGAGAGTECGGSCDGIDASKCNPAPTTRPCGSNTCVAGIEQHPGFCSGAGSCAATTKSCGAYACGPAACLTSCVGPADCSSGNACKAGACVPVEGLGTTCTEDAQCSSKHCVDGVCCADAACPTGSSCAFPGKAGTCEKRLGLGCASDGECGSGHCVDGVCCESACGGQCEACDVEGRKGSCAPVVGGPHGARTPCDVGSSVCAARACDGGKSRTVCEGFAAGPSTSCAAATCAGSAFVGAGHCDGAGGCSVPASNSCSPYGCSPTGCRTTCSVSEDCATGFSCRGSRCEPKSAECTPDRTASVSVDGRTSSCQPFICRTDSGDCATTCLTSDDCASGFACDGATHLCAPSSTGPSVEEDAGGCSHGPPPRAGAALLFSVVVLLFARKRGAR